jgi:hypothetical protein
VKGSSRTETPFHSRLTAAPTADNRAPTGRLRTRLGSRLRFALLSRHSELQGRGKGVSVRKSGHLLIPLTFITAWYGGWVMLAVFMLESFPALEAYFPIGGIAQLAASDVNSFEPVYTNIERTILSAQGPIQLLFASIGALVLTVPVSWVYFTTSRQAHIDQSFLQTIMILPIVVTGISMIVLNSIALAFSLAGIVAAVRFRFTLNQPADAMYIFVAIGIGLGSGIGALGVAAVISAAFCYATLVIWKLEYGKTLAGPFLTMLTRRDHGEDEY